MTVKVEVAPAAKRDIKKLSKDLQREVLAELRSLELKPRPAGVEKIKSFPDLYRIRVARTYRLIYTIREAPNGELLIVLSACHRREAYDRLAETAKRAKPVLDQLESEGYFDSQVIQFARPK